MVPVFSEEEEKMCAEGQLGLIFNMSAVHFFIKLYLFIPDIVSAKQKAKFCP